MRSLILPILLASLGYACTGCSKESSQATDHVHHHDTENHMPTSLGDLCSKIRRRLNLWENGQTNLQLQAELTDLVSWAPEFAADTNVDERLWIPIYESSEQVRSSIETNGNEWNEPRLDQIARLCQLSETAWSSLEPDERIPRYQAHSHAEHDHSDDHSDHDHSDHDHSDHDHSDGDHSHGDRVTGITATGITATGTG